MGATIGQEHQGRTDFYVESQLRNRYFDRIRRYIERYMEKVFFQQYRSPTRCMSCRRAAGAPWSMASESSRRGGKSVPASKKMARTWSERAALFCQSRCR